MAGETEFFILDVGFIDWTGYHCIQEAGDLRRLFDPASYYAEFGAVKAVVFENKPCYAVEAKTKEGYARTLYFDRASGLYAGHEGEGIHLWAVADYAEEPDPFRREDQKVMTVTMPEVNGNRPRITALSSSPRSMRSNPCREPSA